MMGYVIAVFVTVMVLAPVLWMMPSPRQRRQERMRARARSLGLDVRLGELPQTRRARVRREDTRQGVSYRLPAAGARSGGSALLLCRENAASPWESVSGEALSAELQPLLEAFAAAAPGDVVAMELSPLGIAAFWRESGDVDAVERLHAALIGLREALAASGYQLRG